MSHRVGATKFVWLAKTMALMPRKRQEREIQNAYIQTPVFHDWTSHGRGINTSTKQRRFATGTRGYVGSIAAWMSTVLTAAAKSIYKHMTHASSLNP